MLTGCSWVLTNQLTSKPTGCSQAGLALSSPGWGCWSSVWQQLSNVRGIYSVRSSVSIMWFGFVCCVSTYICILMIKPESENLWVHMVCFWELRWNCQSGLNSPQSTSFWPWTGQNSRQLVSTGDGAGRANRFPERRAGLSAQRAGGVAESHRPVCPALPRVRRGKQGEMSSTVSWTWRGKALEIKASPREEGFCSSQWVSFEIFRASVEGCCSSQGKVLFVIFWIIVIVFFVM